jgi:hypothetical protein
MANWWLFSAGLQEPSEVTPLLSTKRHGCTYLTAFRKEATGETYALLWKQDTITEALRTLGRWASNTELSFNWYDAALLAQKIRQFDEGAK